MPELTNKEEVFEYLEKLRKSGKTNMFGAGRFIQKEFGYSSKMAQDYLVAWMESYNA